jgi:hypothetical protein
MRKEYLRYGLVFILVICLSGLFISCGPGPDGDDEEAATTTTGTTAEETTTTATTTTTTTTSATTTLQPPSAPPAFISLAANKVQVQSDNTDFATVTATVLDAGFAVVQGASVRFSATGGQFACPTSPSTCPVVETNSSGESQITFKSGSIDWSNRIETITADVDAAPGVAAAQLVMQIVGSTLELSSDTTSVPEDDPSPPDNRATLTITAKNALGNTIPNAPITLSQVGATGNGQVNIIPSSGTTDSLGRLQVQVAGGPVNSEGTATVEATWGLANSSLVYTVVDTSAPDVFGITAPVDDPYAYNIETPPVTVTITVAGVNTATPHEVVFATSLGGFDAGNDSVVTKPAPAGTVSADFSADETGTATVQVFEREIGGDYTGQTDSLTIAVSAAASDAARITLQSQVANLPVSVGGVEYSTQVIATVETATGNPVGGAPVQFSIENATGGGENVSPVLVFTDSGGTAETTFTSGSSASPATGVTVVATVVGEGTVGPPATFQFIFLTDRITCVGCEFMPGPVDDDDFENAEQIRVSGSANNDGDHVILTVDSDTQLTLDSPILFDEGPGVTGVTIQAVSTCTDIVIGGVAGSVALGGSTVVREDATKTYYIYDMAVIVADTFGNGVPDAEVSVGVWPIYYSTGFWLLDTDSGQYSPCIAAPCAYTPCDAVAGTFANEDANEDTTLDPGEDIGPDPGHGDGQLTPPNAFGGTVLPASLVTDEHGIATFELRYLKASAVWIVDRITASTLVFGTEASTEVMFRLGYMIGDEDNLGPSPFNPPCP